jgi:hypothetical protein
VDAGGVIRYTQVGFEQGDEKKYEQAILKALNREPVPGAEKPSP